MFYDLSQPEDQMDAATLTAWIAQWARDAEGLASHHVVEHFNCREHEIAGGEIWIAEPQAGHWIRDDQKRHFIRYLRQLGA